MITHYSILTPEKFVDLFKSCKSYHEHMMKIAVQYADVKNDETMFEWLSYYFDMYFNEAGLGEDSIEDMIRRAPYITAISMLKDLCRVIAANNESLKPKYEDMCKKYYGRSIQDQFDKFSESIKDTRKQRLDEFESVLENAFNMIDSKRKDRTA